MDISSLKIPSITIPGTKLFSSFTFPPNLSSSTWFIIVFVLGMFLLSCMSNRCEHIVDGFEDPINLYEHTHFDGPMPRNGCGSGTDCVYHYDSADRLDVNPHQSGIIERFEQDINDDGRNFATKPWYSCRMKSNCLPGESDTGDYCIKEGCPSGMEQGAGIGKEFCYPTCAPGYESDGGSRCFKVCPEGYITQGNQCIRPQHEYKKDVIPSKGQRPKMLPAPMPQIPIIVEEPGPVLMNPHLGGWGTSIVRTDVKYPYTHTHNTLNDKRKITHSHNAQSTFMYPSTGPIYSIEPDMIEDFKNQSNTNINPSQSNSVALMEHMANTEIHKDRTTLPKCEGDDCKKSKGDIVWRVEDRIFVDELPCSLGYTLSGDMCYENCPPNYRDTGDSCVLDRYMVARPSYDRGSGVPYATKRAKYQNINPVSQCN